MRAAAKATRNGKIGVIGTEATIRSNVYTRALKQQRPDLEIIGKPCPLFVPLVEEGLWHDSITDEVASRYLSSLKGKYIDTLVMGCTHYPLLRSTFRRLMGEEVSLINPAYETAIELKELLEEKGMSCTQEPGEDPYHFFVSDRAENFTNFATAILSNEIKETKQINIEEY